MNKKCVWLGHGEIGYDNGYEVCERCGQHSYLDDPDNENAYPTGENFYDNARLRRPLWAIRAIWQDFKREVKDRIWRWRNPDLPF